MEQHITDEDIERIREAHPDNFKEHLTRVRRLLKAAKPGNIPFRILETDYGFVGDYDPADAGEPPTQ